MTQEEIKQLVERYPYLLPRNVWTDRVPEDYDYTYLRGVDEIPPGWRLLFMQMCEDIRQPLIDSDFIDKFRFTQIKEKYNRLECYTYGAPVPVQDIIDKYSMMSSYICTVCGKPAIYETLGWIASFCEECRKDRCRHADVIKIKFRPYYKVRGFKDGKRYKKTISFKDEWVRYLNSMK